MRGYLNGEPILARPVTQFECAVKWARRRPAMTAVLGLVALVTALGLGGVLWQWSHAVQGKRQALPAQGVGGRTVTEYDTAFCSRCAHRSDDTDARREARRCVGRSDRRAQGCRPCSHCGRPRSLGLVLVAKQQGLIPAVRPVLGELRRAGMHMTDRLEDQILDAAGESP